MESTKAVIVLADISGYTKFVTLHTMSLLHAEKIVTELLESIIDVTGNPLILNKLEGDAILFYARAGESGEETARAALGQALSFFEAFSARSKELTCCNNLCPCDACRQADQLRLKTVLHFGEIAIKRIRDFEEIAGPPVIAAHRLLKNSIPSAEYMLTTREFAEMSGGFGAKVTENRIEDCEGIGRLDVEVYYPGPGEGIGAYSDDAAEKRNVWRSIANAIRLDAYSFARVLRFKKTPRGYAYPNGTRPGFWRFSADGLRGLWMLFRGK